jgi:hypothetical protein
MTATCTTTAGVFSSRDAAERAVCELRDAGYRDDAIGVVARRADGRVERRSGDGAEYAGEGAAIGAAAGGAALALGSLAVSFGVIPVIGPVLAVGPLAAALISAAGGAAGGAVAGGLIGALVGMGLSDEDARYYENEVKAGKYLVTVECGQGDDARDLLRRNGGAFRPA